MGATYTLSNFLPARTTAAHPTGFREVRPPV